MRPVRLAPWAAGASPTTTMRAAGSPNPGTGRPQYSSSANAARFSVATCSRHCTRRGQRRHPAIDSARPASSSLVLIRARTDRLRRGLSLAKRLRKIMRDPVCVDGAILRSRGPSGPPRSGKSGKNGAPQKSARSRLSRRGHLRSRGPSGPPRSGKSGKSLHLCRDDRSPIGARCEKDFG